jgi:hypothetical protein
MNNSLCPNGLKVASKFDRHHISRLLQQPHLPDIDRCDCWLFGIGILKGILKDGEFNSKDEIEEAIMKV